MARFFRRKKFCRFTADDVKQIDYKDLTTLKSYITETGKKYHRVGCRYLSKSDITVTLAVAKARGLGPCSVCRPPS